MTACAVQYMDNNKNNVSRKASGNTASVVAIIVVGIFVLCVILLLAKGLFASNSSEVPKGINTATINTNESVAEPVNSTAPADTSVTDNSSVDESGAVTDVSSDESSQTDVLEVMYVTEYAYLHVAPDNDAENIVCMSPGVQVNVLEYEDNGYVKINFMNIDGPLTGYIYKDGGLTLYMHGATEGRKYDVIAANPNVFIEIDTDMVLTSGGEVPCEYGAYYACVMGEGTASILTDVDEKVMGLELLMKNQTGRDFIITESMTKSINVIKVVIPELSVKMNQKK